MRIDKTSSFSLVRTNPKISGNVKITVDSAGLIWLNTFDATPELSTSVFKKFRIGTSGTSFESDLKNFIGTIPPAVVFAAKEKNPDPANTSNTFKDQYDFFYNAGAENLISKFYDEEYSYLAPVWLRDDLPEHFIIFRVDEPLDFPYNENVPSGSLVVGKTYVVRGDSGFSVKYGANSFTNTQTFVPDISTGINYSITGTGKVVLLDENKALPIDTIEQFKSIVKRAHIIKTFDLSETTNIGKYIRNIVNGRLFPSSPMTARFDGGLMTTWNGVSYQDGAMTSKGELLEDYWSKGHLQIDFEEYITKGFERHGIICPYLLNLEFLFNDTDTPIYSIPRYFGFYVSKIEIANLQLDGNSLYDNRATSGNTPAPKRPNRGFRQQEESFFQSNPDGVRLFYMNEVQADPSTPLFVPSSDTFLSNFETRFYWLQDKNGNFYSLDQTGNTTYNTIPTTKDLVIRNKSVDLANFAGPGSVKLQDKGKTLVSNGRSYMVVRINEQLFPNDKLFLYWNLGLFTDVNGKYHVLTANDLSSRPFTVPANGTVITIVGMDLTSQYRIGETIQLKFGAGNSVLKVLTSAPIFAFGNTTLNIDSPINATVTSGTTPIVPGWGPGSAIISHDNDTIYYHPYGTFNEIASAIAKALNLVEDRSFDAVAIDNQVVVRMRKGESSPNSFFMMAQLTLTDELFFQNVQFVPNQKFYFEGGTDTAHIRLKFPFSATDILKDGEVFLKTKRGLSKIAFVGRYVDEAINAVGSSEVGDLVGFREFGALYISDNLDEPAITTIGDFIAYNLFEIPVGLFSIFNVKEIDGDFFSSTYSRSPITEVHRYFDIFADTTNVLVPGRKYLVKSNFNPSSPDSISYLGNTHTVTSTGNSIPFTAGTISGELSGVGNGVQSNFVFNLLYPPIEPGTFVLTDSVEFFTEIGTGILTGTIGGTGTIDYETGAVNVSFFGTPLNLQNITSSYNSLSGFTVTAGNPIVVARIFHAAHVLPNTPLDPTHTYMIFGDPSEFVHDSIVPSNYIYASFSGAPLTALSTYYTTEPGGGSPLVIDITAFALDEDLKAFSGFWTFKDLVDVHDNTDTSTIEFSNREKFVHHDIVSEYDYLKENFSKEESVKSRLFPLISKWVYQGGDDVRDNPYRLNTHPIFGALNFSPSFVIKTQNPDGFSHEWPYLEQAPQQYPSGLLNDNYYFFYDRIDLSKIQDANPAHRDYFSDYFTFTPAEDTAEQERFNIFKFNNEIGLCEAFFRGIKIRIKEVIKDTKIQQLKGTKPPFKDGSQRYADYKISVLLRPMKQEPSMIESPVVISVTENKTHKIILLTIDLIIEDYRTLTMIDPSNVGTYIGSPIIDYPGLQDSNVDYLLLYSMKSKKSEKTDNDTSLFSTSIRGLDGHDLADIKLSFGINPASPSGAIGNRTVINVFDNPNYDWDVRDEIKNFNKENILAGLFPPASVFFPASKFPYPLEVNQSKIFFGFPGNTSYSQDFGFPYPDFEAPVPSSIFIPYGSQFDWVGFPWTQVHGGNLYLEPIMERIAFGKIAEKINLYSQFIKYKTFYWDEASSTTKSNENEFYLELAEPSKITLVEAIVPQTDTDKPEEFKNESVIGVNYITTPYFNELHRYSGPYEPKFQNILFFKDQKTDQISGPNIDLSFKQATLNPAVAGFGLLKNLGYLKVSTKDVLSLTNNPKYKSRYPLLGEVPIDKRDFFMFQSNWDPGFWRTYTTKKDFFSQAGTREMEEVKNFFGTKIMKTHPSLRLQDWTIEPQVASLDMINVDNFNGEIVYAVVAGKVQALINVKKRLLRFLVSDGADVEFKKYLMSEFGTGDPSTLNDDVIEYLTLNVLPTYEVSLVDLYIRKYQQNLGLALVRGDLTDAQKLQNQYLVDKNFSVSKKSDFVYYFEYVLDKSFNVSLAPSLTISKI
jgi:hypothetical protein